MEKLLSIKYYLWKSRLCCVEGTGSFQFTQWLFFRLSTP